jgi:uncharacterized protein YoxC
MNWIIIVYISALIIAVSFSVLVYYIIRTLKSTERALDQVATSIKDVEEQVDGISQELTSILHKTNKAAEQIEKKSQGLTKIAASFSELGDEILTIQKDVKKFLQSVSKKINMHNDGISQAINLGSSAISFVKKWREKNL